MGWSIRLFSVAGTAVRIHLTFFLLLAFDAWVGWRQGGAPAAIDLVTFIALLFVCVVLIAAQIYVWLRKPKILIEEKEAEARLPASPQELSG